MTFENHYVPGNCWVQITEIRNKDGSPLPADNYRQRRIGMVTMCWIAGGLRQRSAFFKGDIRMENGNPVEVNLAYHGWCSTTEAQPVEVEPDVFELTTHNCIYRFRILTEEEESIVHSTVSALIENEMRERLAMLMQTPTDAGNGAPIS